MKRQLGTLLLTACLTATAAAQNQLTYEQLQHQYNDALTQLKIAQDRKNELADANQKLQKTLADAQALLQTRNEALSGLQEHDYFLRRHYAAWEQFISRNPGLKAIWLAYFGDEQLGDKATELLGDGTWPFTVQG